ncbi:MAG: PD-(D/E)XK nuclease family protein [Segniliparus sp.]|uniref:PD-(D/E)XK nuclease family protein n=1 Tax=Segniliparus sp. TaxID=2804064 RepID=UPI003F31F691
MTASQPFDEPARLFQESALARREPVMVVGGPGTGKTRLVVELACHWALRPETAVVVLASNRAAADLLRGEIHRRLLRASPELVLAKPLVRTTHSYAFALLEAKARTFGNPPPRLIPAAEQDATLRELAAEQAGRWPASLRGALGSAEFTAQLRSVFQRAAQHGHGPEGLIALGKERGRPEWVAAGRTWQEYEQVMTLRNAVGMADPAGSPGSLDAAELLTAALDAAAEDPDLLTVPKAGPIGPAPTSLVVLVDDAQHFDPQAARLVNLLVRRADLAVLAADPDQSVFWFQGAQTSLDLWRRAERLRLGPSWRLSAPVAELVEAVAPRAAGKVATSRESGTGEARVRLYPTTAAQAEGVVEALCRAHARDHVPWSKMAVLVRSVPAFAPSLARAAALAGVPLRTAGASGPLAANTTVSALLVLLKALAGTTLEPSTALALLLSPLAGATIAEARALRRRLRAQEPDRPSLESLAALVFDEDRLGDEEDGEEAPESVLRLRAVWRSARAAAREARGVEDVLWAAWSASELEERWGDEALAEPDFAAVNALFAAARAHASPDSWAAGPRDTGQALARFADRIEGERLPVSGRLGGEGLSEAVALSSAHAAAGQEWDVVVVCGVQEGLWPGLSESSSLLGVDDLAAALSGIEAEARLDMRKQVLAQERRLLYLACSRAREQLLVTAVEGEGDLVPSRFLAPLARFAQEESDVAPRQARRATPWSAAGVVAELRSRACGADEDGARRAASALADLARVGVIGAHPKSWHGLAEVSTDEPLGDGGAVTLSPSRVEQLLVCPLRWLYERAATSAPSEAAAAGTAVHLLAAVSGRFAEEELSSALDEAIRQADARSARPPWAAGRRRDQLERLLATFSTWLGASRGELAEVGVEIPVEMTLPALSGRPAALSESRARSASPALPRKREAPPVDSFRLAAHPADAPGLAGTAPEVKLKGRIDRLEKNADGELVIVDLKTAKTPRSAADVREDAQLACYQLIVRAARDEPVAGARLVFLGAPRKEVGAAEREQPALAEDSAAEWTGLIREAAGAATGPAFRARPNSGCGSCPGRRCCPVFREEVFREEESREEGSRETGLRGPA